MDIFICSETDGSSTNKPATIEMYAPASGSGGSYTNGPNETSLSASDEEKHSEGAYSGQTDYVMVIIEILSWQLNCQYNNWAFALVIS